MSSTRIAPSEIRTPVRVLTVEINRASPAYAALEDIRLDAVKIQRAPTYEVLVSGEKFIFKNKEDVFAVPKVEIAKQNINERELPALAVAVEGSSEFEAPTMIESAEMLVQEELKKRQEARELQPFKVPSGRKAETIYTASGSPITIQRMPAAGAATTLASADVKASPFQPSRVVTAPGFRDPFSPSRTIAVNYIPSKSKRLPSLAQMKFPKAETAPQTTASLAFNDTPKVSFASTSASDDVTAQVDPSVGAVSVRGPIRFVNGMAFSPGDDEIKIYQEYGSGYLASGAFYFNQGQYQIPVSEAKGRIIAEVRNRAGELIGRGQVDVRTLSEKMLSQSIINEVGISISPAQSAFTGEVVAAASSFKTLSAIEDSKLVVADLNREIIREPRQKIFVDQGFQLGSTALLKGSARGYWSSLAVAEAGSPIQLGLFPEHVVSAMLSLASKTKFDARDNEDKAIIWGRVTIDGKPVENATVTLLSEPNIKAVYFSGVIPDRNRITTSANGEFVFVGATNPAQVLQATINNRKQVPIFAFAEKKAVTQVDYVVTKAKEIEFSAYNSSTLAKLPMRFNFVGSDKYSEMLKPMAKRVRKALPLGMSMVEFDAGEQYAMTRVVLDGNEREVSAPMFSSQWANSFGQGLVVGEVDGDNYMISFDGVDFSDAQVKYLDAEGQPTDAATGKAGQRFVVSGLSNGFHTLTILPANSKQALTQIVFVDDQAVHFVKKSISE